MDPPPPCSSRLAGRVQNVLLKFLPILPVLKTPPAWAPPPPLSRSSWPTEKDVLGDFLVDFLGGSWNFLEVSGGFLGGSCNLKKSRQSAKIDSKIRPKSEIFGVRRESREPLGGVLGRLGTSWIDLDEEV